MNMKNRQKIILFLLFVVLAASTHLIQRQIRGKLGEAPPTDILYLPQGKYVKVIALGFDSFWADLLWIRSLQYFGGHFLYDSKYPVIDRLLEVITTLEPSFIEVYGFGAMILHEVIKDRDKGVVLLNKGIENNPENWHLPYQLGFLWLEELQGSKDTTYRKFSAEKAMEAYALTTTKPGCPEFVNRIVIQMNYAAGLKDLAKKLWEMNLQEAEEKGDKIGI